MDGYRVNPPTVARGWFPNQQIQVGCCGTVQQALRQQGHAVEGFDEPSSLPNPWPSPPGMAPWKHQAQTRLPAPAQLQQGSRGEASVEAVCERGFQPRRHAGR